MSLQDRGVLVKNDDISITYVGNWTTVPASAVNNLGNFGPAFSPTLHSTTTISSFTLPFHGSSINVVGTINIASSSTNPNPTWQCFLDGINIGPPKLFQFPENNWIMCNQGNIADSAHELVVNVTSQGMPFYLDYIEYRPSSSVSLENSLILFQNEDRAINYISGWSALTQPPGGADQTTDPEGLVNVTFIGIQLSWYGIIPSSEPHNASSGEYSIDGQPYSSFQLLGLPKSTSATQYNQLFFITPTLEMGTHTLSAKYTGSAGQTPLTLDFLIVANGSFPFTNSLPPNSSVGAGKNPTSNSAPPMNASTMNASPMNDISKSSSHVGRIAGGVVGAVGGTVVCLIILFFWLRSRKRRSRSRDNVRSITEPIQVLDLVQSQFVSQAAPLLAPNQTARSQGTLYTHPSQPPPNSASPYVTDETSSTRRLPAPAPSRFIPSAPVVRTPTITHIQHEDSGIRLPQPVLDEIVVEMPPAYSEL